MDVLKVAACKGGKTPKVEISAQGGGATLEFFWSSTSGMRGGYGWLTEN